MAVKLDKNETVSLYEGAVLDKTQKYNSSMDFTSYYAIVWDDASQSIKEVHYDCDMTTRNGSCQVDATPEVKEKARQFNAQRLFREYVRIAQAHALRVNRGSFVVVQRGRKVAKGTTGRVMWMGDNTWGQTQVGLKVEGHQKLIYTAESNCDLVEVPRISEETLWARALTEATKY